MAVVASVMVERHDASIMVYSLQRMTRPGSRESQSLLTEHASKALELAKVFTLFVGSTPLASTRGDVVAVELTAPSGPSTGAGVQNLQHITFTQGPRILVVGSIDRNRYFIELRGYTNLSRLYKQRWRGLLPITNAEYEAFLKRVRAFATSQQLAIVVKELDLEQDVSRRRSWLPFLALALCIAVGALLYLQLR